jgi:hypothetical protein
MLIRPYNPETDVESLRRIWREIGWLKDDQTAPLDRMLEAGRAYVAELDGAAESFALTTMGSLRHLDQELPKSFVQAVGTSRIARRRGAALRVTAQAIARDVADGALVAGLGIFDQGFYDRLGFGNGPYIRWSRFDPATLRVEPNRRPPVRLGKDDWRDMHDNRLRRRRGHGALNLTPPEATHAELEWTERGFGLGFRDGPNGELTHHIWLGNSDDPENGPYRIWWLAFETVEQFHELLGVLKGLGDQVGAIRLVDPPGIQMQRLIDKPFRQRLITRKAEHEVESVSWSYWQVRICDLAACLARTKLNGETLRFNLRLTDPIEPYLPDDAAWRGTGGEYIVTLGPTSGAESGRDASLPTMTTTINTFTRLWLGVRPASGLIFSDELDAPHELIGKLDEVLRLPEPCPDWDY